MADHGDHSHSHDHELPQVDHFDAATTELAGALRRSFGVLKLVMFVLVILYMLSGWFSVERGERAVVYRFGDIVGRESGGAVKGEGWYLSWPFPIDRHVKVSTSPRTLPVSFMLEVSDKERASGKITSRFGPLSPERDDYLVTGDENIIHGSFEIRYEIDENEIVEYLQNVYDMPAPEVEGAAARPQHQQRPEYTLLTNLARNAVIDTAMGWEAMALLQNRQDSFLRGIESNLKKRLDALSRDGVPLGIRLSDSGGVIAAKQMELEAIMPPRQTKEAFDRVFTVEQRKSQQIAMARSRGQARLLQACGGNYEEIAEAIDREFDLILELSAVDGKDEAKQSQLAEQQIIVEKLLEESAGSARSTILQAKAIKDEIIKDAKGDYDRMVAVLPEYIKNPGVFISRQTEEMMAMALSFSGVTKIVVPPQAKEIRLTIPRDDEPPIGKDADAEGTKIDTDSLDIPASAVRAR